MADITTLQSPEVRRLGLVAAMGAGIREIYTKYQDNREKIRAEAELRGLSDRMLKDIGIMRGDIKYRIWGERN